MAHGLQQFQSFICRQFHELRFHFGIEEHCFCGCHEFAHSALEFVIGELLLVAIDDVHVRLRRQKRQLSHRLGIKSGGKQRCSLVQDLHGLLSSGKYRRLRLVVARLFGQARYRVLQGLKIGQDQLRVDRLDVVSRRDPTLHVHNVVVVKRA